jgi:MFS family permease
MVSATASIERRHSHGVILFTMCLGVFIAQLDSQVVNLAVKQIGTDLNAGISQLQWVLDSYNLFYATLLLTGGTLGDLYGRVRIFAGGIGLIVLGSIVCALAHSGAVLIAGRALTGIGAALEVPTSLAILTVTYSDAKERAGAMVPLDVFRNAAFSAALAVAGMMTFGMYAMLFLTPLYLQALGGFSAFTVGLQLLPLSVTFVVVSHYSGALAKRFGARGVMTGGMGAMGAGLLLLTLISPTPDMVLIATALLIIGLGLGLNTGPVNAVAVASLPPARSGTASGLVNTSRMIGATLGIAALGALYAVHAGANSPQSMVDGLRLAYLGGAVVEIAGALIALAFVRSDSMEQKSN